MLRREGITLMEIIVVLTIIGVATVFSFPNYTTPVEKARVTNAQNNLLAIYSAQQNYRNNNGSYCTNNPVSSPCPLSLSATCGGSLAYINCSLSLNIQDDGTYTYFCRGVTCTATRTNSLSDPTMVVTLNAAIRLSGNVNPTCTTSNNWCP